MNRPVIEFRDFTWQYFSQAEPTLHNIDLTVHEGEKVLICGPSGCGKSTLLHCLNGLIPFSYRGESTGSLRILGRETKELSVFDLSKMCGTVLQDSDSQFVGLTVAEDIAFSLENDCVPQQEMIDRVLRTAQEVEVDTLLDHSPQDLSGGQKQRVSMAGIMVDNVPIYLFDEPLANLDPATGKQAIELIDDIFRKKDATCVIIEHRLEDVLHRDVDRVILMDDGRIVADLAPDELLCSDLLAAHGIREPLYITALKHAGVTVTPDMCPRSISSLRLDSAATDAVRSWFAATPDVSVTESEEVLLHAGGLTFSYDGKRAALEDITLDIRRGEMMAVVGKNGAGKSTFAKLICGFETPQKGTLTYEGEDLSSLSIKERSDRIGYVMQNPNQMISQIKVWDEVALGLRSRGVPEETGKEKVEQVLRICGLYPFRNWPISALSFGQRKRVTIASILSLDPGMIILDEPTAGQDYRHYTEIMEFLRSLNRAGLTILLITHDMHLMQEYCRRTVVFADSRKIADLSPAQVLTDPDIIEKAYLKKTSLYDLAVKCGLDDPYAFVRRFIDCDREARS